ncbi:hypothetical protein GQ457_16G014170 [Hibiscus cannabinus]
MNRNENYTLGYKGYRYSRVGIDTQMEYRYSKTLLESWSVSKRNRRQRVRPGQIFLADSDLSRASCRVIGLCLSPNNCSACLYTVPSTVGLSPHAIRCRKVPFLTSRNSIASS